MNVYGTRQKSYEIQKSKRHNNYGEQKIKLVNNSGTRYSEFTESNLMQMTLALETETLLCQNVFPPCRGTANSGLQSLYYLALLDFPHTWRDFSLFLFNCCHHLTIVGITYWEVQDSQTPPPPRPHTHILRPCHCVSCYPGFWFPEGLTAFCTIREKATCQLTALPILLVLLLK